MVPIMTASSKRDHRRKYRQQAVDGVPHFAIIAVGDLQQHLVQLPGFFTHADHLQGQARKVPAIGQVTRQAAAGFHLAGRIFHFRRSRLLPTTLLPIPSADSSGTPLTSRVPSVRDRRAVSSLAIRSPTQRYSSTRVSQAQFLLRVIQHAPEQHDAPAPPMPPAAHQ